VLALSARVPRSICFQHAPTIVRSSGQGLRRFLNVSADATIMFQMRKDIPIGSSSFSAIGEQKLFDNLSECASFERVDVARTIDRPQFDITGGRRRCVLASGADLRVL